MPAAVAPVRSVDSELSWSCVSTVRPASTARSWAAARCASVKGRLASTSQPARFGSQPWRRTAAGLMKAFGEGG